MDIPTSKTGDNVKKLEINELHEVLFGALCYVNDVCERNNIQYYLAYGTLLGAIRGSDFIPWDPDVDLFMSRENYQKFCQVMENEKNDKYFLDTVDNNPYSITPLEGRVCIRGTVIRVNIKGKVPLRKEIRIDIAPLDFSSLDKEYVIHKNRVLHVYEQFIYLKYLHVINIKRPASYLLDLMLKVIPYKMALRKILKLAGENRSPDKEKFVCLTAAYTCNKKKPLRNEYPVEWFGEPEYYMFHGKEFPCPRESHKFLRFFYGDDYMTPIPREEQG